MAVDAVTDASEGQRIVIVQTTIPDYRVPFFRSLGRRLGERLTIIAGEDDFARDIVPAPGLNHVRAKNRFLLRRLLWQEGVLRQVLTCEVAVLVLNPRIISNWFGLLIRRALGRRTLLWGHCWPRAGRYSKSDRIRGLMRGLADGLIVYTEAEAAELRTSSAGVEVVAAPNALYERHQMSPLPTSDEPSDFVFVGRLTSAKKPHLLLEAFRGAAPLLEASVNLVFVGDGPLRRSLERESARAELADRVRFLGHVSDPEELRGTYAKAIASVSPGYAGLSLIQSLGFGIPMIIARDEPHAPEIEAAVEGENAIYFQRDAPAALQDALLAVARDRWRWSARREEIGAPIRTRYSIEGMVESFVAALASSCSKAECGGANRL